MARAAMAVPMSAASQPKVSRRAVTDFLAASLFPQMNMVGWMPLKSGLTMEATPTVLKALTKLAEGNSCCSCSMSEVDEVV